MFLYDPPENIKKFSHVSKGMKRELLDKRVQVKFQLWSSKATYLTRKRGETATHLINQE